MLELNQVQLRRGARVRLDRTSMTVHAGQKVGLVGANGIGKSSLFQLILGKLEADEGVVRVPKGWRVAHLAQEVAATPRIARDYVLDGDRPLRALQHAIAEAERGQHFEKLGELHEQLDSAGGSTSITRGIRPSPSRDSWSYTPMTTRATVNPAKRPNASSRSHPNSLLSTSARQTWARPTASGCLGIA